MLEKRSKTEDDVMFKLKNETNDSLLFNAVNIFLVY